MVYLLETQSNYGMTTKTEPFLSIIYYLGIVVVIAGLVVEYYQIFEKNGHVILG